MSSDYPSFTQIPNWLLDDWLPDLTGTELKVLLYVFRRTAGFGKEWDAISINQFLHGISSHSGTYTDRGCGVHSRPHVLEALLSLEQEHGLIQSFKERSPNGGALPTLYSHLVPIRNQGVVPIGNQGGSQTVPRVVPDRHPQKKEVQKKPGQENRARPSEQLSLLWQQVLVSLAGQMSTTNFSTWLRDSLLLDYQDRTMVIGVPNQYQLDHVQSRMKPLIEKALRDVIGETILTRYTIFKSDEAVS